MLRMSADNTNKGKMFDLKQKIALKVKNIRSQILKTPEWKRALITNKRRTTVTAIRLLSGDSYSASWTTVWVQEALPHHPMSGIG